AVLAGLTGRIASAAGAASPGGDTFQVARWQDPFTSGDFRLATPYTSAVEGRGGGPSRCPAGGRADGRAGGCARARAGCSVGGHAQWRDQSSPAGHIFGRRPVSGRSSESTPHRWVQQPPVIRSEERRVGKECRLGGAP